MGRTRVSSSCVVESRHMKFTRTKALVLFVVLALAVSIPVVVSAQEVPHFITGLAYVDGRLAAGDRVQAFIDGNEVFSGQVNNSGRYVAVIANPSSGPAFTGKTITFRVRGLSARETLAWAANGNDTTFNLNASTRQSTNTPVPTRRTVTRQPLCDYCSVRRARPPGTSRFTG